MTGDPTDLYPAISQIAATFAGFGSLASGLGQRRGAADPRMDAYRLSLMLFGSLSATMLGLLPATLAAMSLDADSALRLAAGAGAIAVAINAPRSSSRVLKLRRVAGFSLAAGLANTIAVSTSFVAFALCVAGVWPNRLAGIYLLGLVALLGSSVIMFSRVIVSLLRPHSEAEEP